MSSTFTLVQLLVLLLRMVQHPRALGNAWLLLQFGQADQQGGMYDQLYSCIKTF